MFRFWPMARGGAIACSLLLSAIAAAQVAPSAPASLAHKPTPLSAEPGLPRTPDGHPDFQGAVWTTNFFSMLEASPTVASLVVSEAHARVINDTLVKMFTAPLYAEIFDEETLDLMRDSRGLPIVRGERRSRLIVLPADGKLPLTPQARKELMTMDPLMGKLDNPEERSSMERCLVMQGAPPVGSTLALNYLQFIQTPDYVVVHTEYGDEARIIPFADTHRPAMLRSRLGDSIAKWDGDTLVIETIGLPGSDRVRALPRFIVSAEATVIERYTRLSRDELLYQYTVIDPNVYTAPWLAEHSLYRSDKRMYEHACHEGNYSLPNILLGQRVADERAAAAR